MLCAGPLRVYGAALARGTPAGCPCRCASPQCCPCPRVQVVRQHEFTATSVSAENWVPIEEVAVKDMAAWLRRQKAAGWRLVGLEQAPGSVPVYGAGFGDAPVVLVVGPERGGIPVDVALLLDDLVSLPQLGANVQCANVQVTAAVALYEYLRQTLPPAPAPVAT